ncbi:hypothetical protein NUU61_007047 [Penicillium alfredii]|uniref:Uncharacterized protein n=1 Tax=Penicillium alfredii TaxID=1506179 RepID=A0A9W9K4U5_9EURO|nr:uncharacterized protein NUU61_007047 [Penicillium alfredii]KAJ5092177.1 hypothetical protein NUU61_007047 [Penicillium alfredii]
MSTWLDHSPKKKGMEAQWVVGGKGRSAPPEGGAEIDHRDAPRVGNVAQRRAQRLRRANMQKDRTAEGAETFLLVHRTGYEAQMK